MKHRFFAFAIAMAAVATLASAQGPKGKQTGPNPLDLSRVQTVEGPVTLLDLGYGVQYPSLVVNNLKIKIAPVWFFLDHDFEIGTGDQLRISAAPSTTPGDSYLYALEITRAATGDKITLRDSTGQPLWFAANRRGGNGSGGNGGSGNGSGSGNPNPVSPGNGSSCIDPASAATASGTVDSVTAGVGIRQPVVVLKAGTTLLTIRIGPERVLLDSGFEIKTGATLTIRYASASTGELVALTITDASGATLTLRNPDGTPAWNN